MAPTAVAEGTAVVHVSDNQFHLVDYGGDYSFNTSTNPNGLITPGAGAAVVVTGTPFGPVTTTVQTYDSAPEASHDVWDEVVEVSLYTFSGEFGLQECSGPKRTDLPVYHGEPDEWIRVRVHARGRDTGNEYSVPPPEPVEQHLIQIWPAPRQDEIRHRLTDQVGQQRRRRS